MKDPDYPVGSDDADNETALGSRVDFETDKMAAKVCTLLDALYQEPAFLSQRPPSQPQFRARLTRKIGFAPHGLYLRRGGILKRTYPIPQSSPTLTAHFLRAVLAGLR